MFVTCYCEISFLQFNKYYYSVNYLFSRFSYTLVFQYAAPVHFSIAVLHDFNIVPIYYTFRHSVALLFRDCFRKIPDSARSFSRTENSSK